MQMTCATCGHTGKPKVNTPGSILIEIVLWLCFLVPGLIYSLWRHAARKKVCGACGAATLMPPGSPAAQRLGGGAKQSVADELAKLAQLRDSGALTGAEFDAQKARILARP